MNISKGIKKLIRYALYNIKTTRIAKKRLDQKLESYAVATRLGKTCFATTINFEVKHMYKGKLNQENENEEQMGNNLIKENYEENALDKQSVKQLENDDFELHDEDRNLLRKLFLKILKRL